MTLRLCLDRIVKVILIIEINIISFINDINKNTRKSITLRPRAFRCYQLLSPDVFIDKVCWGCTNYNASHNVSVFTGDIRVHKCERKLRGNLFFPYSNSTIKRIGQKSDAWGITPLFRGFVVLPKSYILAKNRPWI